MKTLTEKSDRGSSIDLCLIGLYIFTFAIITLRWPIANIGIGIAIVGLILRGQSFRAPLFFWLLCAYVFWCVLASAVSEHWNLAEDALIDRFKIIAMVLIFLNSLRTANQFRAFLVFIIFCFMVYPIRGALQNYYSGYTIFGRALWNYSYSNPNDLATLATLAFGVMITVAMAPGQKRYLQFFAGGSAAATLLTIFLTQSRGALIGLAIGFGPSTLRAIVKSPRRIALATIVVFGVALAVPESAWLRFAGISKLTSTETISEADPEGSADERFKIAKTAWRIWLDHPVLGTGLDSYRAMNYRYSPELGPRDAHNTYLNLAAEIGLPGLAIWLTCIGSVFALSRKIRKQYQFGTDQFQGIWIQRALVAFLIAGLFGTYSRLNMLYFVLSLLWVAIDLTKNAHSSTVAPTPTLPRRSNL